MNKILISLACFVLFMGLSGGGSAIEIKITSPNNVTFSDTKPDLNITTNEVVNITYNWNGEGNITGCLNCTSYNTTYGELSGNAIDDSLVLALNFNENTGNRTKDDSRWGNDPIILSDGSSIQWTRGKYGYALNNSYYNPVKRPGMFYIPNTTPNFNATLNITKEFTIMAWIKHPGGYYLGHANNGISGEPILTHGQFGDCDSGECSGFNFGVHAKYNYSRITSIFVDPTKYNYAAVAPIIHIWQSSIDYDNFVDLAGETTCPPNDWCFVGATFDITGRWGNGTFGNATVWSTDAGREGGKSLFYLNFHNHAYLPNQPLISNTSGYAIGFDDGIYSTGKIFNGSIDSIYLWNRSFSLEEIRELYGRMKEEYIFYPKEDGGEGAVYHKRDIYRGRSGLLDGRRNVTVYVSADDTNESTRYFTIDATPPTFTIQSPTNTTYTNGSRVIWLNTSNSTSENISTWFYELDSNGTKIIFTQNTSTTLTEGRHNLTIYANDSYANTNSTNIYFTVDLIPEININQALNTTVSDRTPTLNLTIIEHNLGTLFYSLDGSKNVTLETGNISSWQGELSNNWTVGSGGDDFKNNITFTNTTPLSKTDDYAELSDKLYSTYGSSSLSLLMNFNDDVGQYANDSTTNNNTGSIISGSWVNGYRGQAIEFDGSSTYIDIPNTTTHFNSSLNITKNFTMLAWINPSSTLGTSIIIGHHDVMEVMGYTGFDLGINSENKPYLTLGMAGKLKTVTSKKSLVDNEWSLVGARFNGTDMSIWLNGIDVGSLTTPTDRMESNNLGYAIGARIKKYNLKFSGKIDEVYIFNKSLSDSEMLGAYTASYLHTGNFTSIAKNHSSWFNDFSKIGFIGELKAGTNVSIYTQSSSDNVTFKETLIKQNATSNTLYPIPSGSRDAYMKFKFVLGSNNGTYSPIIYNITMLGTLADGQHNVTAYVNDTAGNTNQSTRFFTVSAAPSGNKNFLSVLILKLKNWVLGLIGTFKSIY